VEIFENWTTISGILANFLLCIRRNSQNSTSSQFLSQNLKPPWAVSSSTTNFGGAYYKIYACFEQIEKNVFSNAKLLEFRASGGGVTIF